MAGPTILVVLATVYWQVVQCSGQLGFHTEQEAADSSNRCEECRLLVKGINLVATTLPVHVDTEALAWNLCLSILPLMGHNGTAFCPHLMIQYLPEAKHFIMEDLMSSVCELLKVCTTSTEKLAEHSNTELGPALDYVEQQQQASQIQKQEEAKFLTFVQLSDIHLDRSYTKNAATDCGYTICCRTNITGQGSAGTFGSYRCDSSEATVNAILDFIQTLRPAPDFFVYVGDSSPHVLLETLEEKLADNLLVNSLLVDKLRHMGPIFPALGNHEMFPTSLYKRTSPNTRAILQSVADQWPVLFNVTNDQLRHIRSHGYYTVLVTPGLRLLATNSLYDYLYNLYAISSDMDPVKEEQRRFVRQTLQLARNNSEKVILISHIKPSVYQTYPSHTDHHNRLLAEFSDVITLQLFGHEHWDVFLLNSHPDRTDQMTGVSLVAPSMTPYLSSSVGVNPSLRLYQLDPVTREPRDYQQFYLDLAESNEQGVPVVKKHYTFTEEYHVPDMSVKSFQQISHRIHKNWTDFQKFEANYYVLANDRPKCSEQDVLCRRQLTCQTRESKPGRFLACLLGR